MDTGSEVTLAYYRYLVNEKKDELSNQRLRLKASNKSQQAETEEEFQNTVKTNIISNITKRGKLLSQYSKKIDVNFKLFDESFRQYNCKPR